MYFISFFSSNPIAALYRYQTKVKSNMYSLVVNNTPIMVNVALENAKFHGINIHHGIPNKAAGDCVFEAVTDNINVRACFTESLSCYSAFN